MFLMFHCRGIRLMDSNSYALNWVASSQIFLPAGSNSNIEIYSQTTIELKQLQKPHT